MEDLEIKKKLNKLDENIERLKNHLLKFQSKYPDETENSNKNLDNSEYPDDNDSPIGW